MGISRLNIVYEESQNFVIRRHAEGSVAYPNTSSPQINLLRTCFHCWPRCLHTTTVPLTDAIDMLIRGVINVEPSLGEAACAALRRFMVDPQTALCVLSRFTTYLFNPTTTREGSGVKLLPEFGQLLDLWVDIVEVWIHTLIARPKNAFTEEETRSIIAKIDELEAGALFLLASEMWTIHVSGVKIFRMLVLLVEHVPIKTSLPTDEQDHPVHFVDLFNEKPLEKSFLYGFDELLDAPHLARLEQWRQSPRTDVFIRIAHSSNDMDRKLWRSIYPRFLQCSVDYRPQALVAFRETMVAAVTRYHTVISPMAGLSSRAPAAISSRPQTADREGPKVGKDTKFLLYQWHTWVKILCSTATVSESRPPLTQLRDHSRAPSDANANFERERLTTSRGLFRYLTPFLDSEYISFREAAVVCIGSLPSTAYPQLLEDLSMLTARQFYDDSRSKPGPGQVIEQNLNSLVARQAHDDSKSRGLAVERSRRQERLHSAVARIYWITAQHLPHQRSAGRQAALSNVLKFVRNTQTFLLSPEMRDNFALQRLRCHFCGTVERLFDGLSTLKDSDRFIPSNMHLTLYRLCEEWCQLGPQSDTVTRRFLSMQKLAAVARCEPDFQRETVALSDAAIGAMASLCVSTFYSS